MYVNTKIKVADYYQNDLFKFMPEEMFNILDEAYFLKKLTVKVPKELIDEFENNKNGRPNQMPEM